MNLALLRRRAEIRVGHAARILLAPLLAESEDDDREQLLLLEHSDEVDPQRRVARLHRPSVRSRSTSPRSSSRTPRRDLPGRVPATTVLSSATLSASSPRRASASCGTSPARGKDSRCLALLLLFAFDRLGRLFVARTEELALGVDNLVQLFARVEEVLERDGTLRRRYDVDVLFLGAAVQRSRALESV